MPKIEDFSMASLLGSVNDEVAAFNDAVNNFTSEYRSELSEELNEIAIQQDHITQKIRQIDTLASQTLGATQARLSRVQNDIYGLRGGKCS